MDLLTRPTGPCILREERGGWFATGSGQLADSLSLEPFGQPLASTAQTHVDRSSIDPEDLGNLAGIVIECVTQGQDLAVGLRQLLHDVAQLCKSFLSLHAFEWR